ncbi:MAG: glutathione peroxidase, partial [Kiritimatiellae bacterium]|nr:glutathione peroxidase [Kiritimatiellia bacterium]
SWNFNKFLIGKDGRVLGRYGSRTEPGDPALAAAIEAALTVPAP